MIKIVKVCLRKVLHHKGISLDELQTIVAEIQSHINNRPLTYISSNRDSPEALTKSHLLCGRPILLLGHKGEWRETPASQLHEVLLNYNVLITQLTLSCYKSIINHAKCIHIISGNHEFLFKCLVDDCMLFACFNFRIFDRLSHMR